MRSGPPLSDSHRSTLMSNTWFAGLPEVARDDILAQARRRVLTSGQRLYSRGDPSDGVYGVLEGSVRVSGTSRAGREAVLDFFGPGSLIGEISTLDGGPRTHDARAYGPTLLLQVSPADFEDLLARHRALSRMLLRLKAKRLRILLGWIEATSTQPLRQRIASRLLMPRHRPPSSGRGGSHDQPPTLAGEPGAARRGDPPARQSDSEDLGVGRRDRAAIRPHSGAESREARDTGSGVTRHRRE